MMKFVLSAILLSCFQVFAETAPSTPETNTAPATAIAATAIAPISEEQIPVHLEPVKKNEGGDSSMFRALAGLSVVGILLAGGYFLINRYRRADLAKNNAHEIKVLRQHYLGPKKSLAIIRVAGESILIGVTDSNINLIKSLSLLDEDVPEEAPKNFKIPAASGEDEDFAISGIRDFVSDRLKNMRSIN